MGGNLAWWYIFTAISYSKHKQRTSRYKQLTTSRYAIMTFCCKQNQSILHSFKYIDFQTLMMVLTALSTAFHLYTNNAHLGINNDHISVCNHDVLLQTKSINPTLIQIYWFPNIDDFLDSIKLRISLVHSWLVVGLRMSYSSWSSFCVQDCDLLYVSRGNFLFSSDKKEYGT